MSDDMCPCDCDELPEFTLADVQKVLDYIGSTAQAVVETKFMGTAAAGNLAEVLLEGMNEEREHCDITQGDALLSAKIALAHLREDPEYYTKLKAAMAK